MLTANPCPTCGHASDGVGPEVEFWMPVVPICPGCRRCRDEATLSSMSESTHAARQVQEQPRYRWERRGFGPS